MTSRHHDPTSTPYKRAFFAACAAAGVLAVGIIALGWRLHRISAPRSAGPQTMASASGHPGHAAQGAAPAATVPPLAPFQLSPQRLQSIGVQVGTVESKTVSDVLRLSGTVEVNERRVSYVQSRVGGWIRDVYVNATGDRVRKGQPLFTIYSPDLVATEHEYLLARKNADDLAGSPVAGVAAGAESLLGAARERLRQWQIPAAAIDALERTGEVSNDLAVEAPASGYVLEKNALPNMYVQPDTKLYTIADLSEVWVMAQVFQDDAGRIRPGDRAQVTVDAYPGSTFAGRVDYVLPQLEVTTRTLPVRLVFANAGMTLRPGMYVNATVDVPLGRHFVVPATAVFHSGTRTLVFGYEDDGRIAPKEVEAGPRVGDEQIVLKGVTEGERIVTSANFLIDSEAQLQAAAGAFAPPPSSAAVAAPRNAPVPGQANVEVTTDPSPPRKGLNTVRVKLTTADGRGIGGAEVTVTFFLPAMPAMGMAAMKTVVTAADRGGGMYEGTGDLRSGGTWQVTIAATQNGQAIASRQLSLTATGGM